MKLQALKNRVADFYRWVDKKNRHPLRNAWILGNISFLPQIIPLSISNPYAGIKYALVQGIIIYSLHKIDEKMNQSLREPYQYQATLDKYLSDA